MFKTYIHTYVCMYIYINYVSKYMFKTYIHTYIHMYVCVYIYIAFKGQDGVIISLERKPWQAKSR